MSQYYVLAQGGHRYSPVDIATLQRWVQESRVIPATILEEARTGKQREAAFLPELLFQVLCLPLPNSLPLRTSPLCLPTIIHSSIRINPTTIPKRCRSPAMQPVGSSVPSSRCVSPSSALFSSAHVRSFVGTRYNRTEIKNLTRGLWWLRITFSTSSTPIFGAW